MNTVFSSLPRALAAGLVLACVHAAPQARADEAADAADQVLITAPPLSVTAPGAHAAREEAARIPGGVNIVGLDEYADGRAANLLDVFALAPGVFIQPRFGAEEARLSIRGSGLQRTFHMRGVYLLQDGVPITLADGSADFQAIEPLALSYTEVLRGANALEFGGITLGGSINFHSPSGHDGAGFRSRVEGGSFNYQRALLSVGDAVGDVDYFVAASAYSQDGYRQGSRQKNLRLFSNLGVKLQEGLESRLFFTAVDTDSQLPGALTQAQLQADATQANAGNLAGRQKRDFNLYRVANRTVLDLHQGLLEMTLAYSTKDLRHPIFQVLQQRSEDYHAGVRYVDERSWGGFDQRLTIGVTPSWNRMRDERFVNLAGEKGAATASSRQRSENLTLFAQEEWALNTRWTAVLGAQWTESRRRYEDLFLGNGDQGLEASYTQFSPKLGVLWHPRERWSVFANVSDSFEPPSFGELTGGVGVDLLNAQRARTIELGSRGEIGFFKWDVAAFAARVRDELLSLNTPDGEPLGTVNAPRTRHRGLEAGWTFELPHALTWQSSYLWSDFRFENHVTYGSNALPGMPKHLYRSELKWAPWPDYFLALTHELSPDRYAIDMAHSWFAESYALWGLKLGCMQEKGLSWFIEGRNLTDERYAATTGVIADARGLDVAQFLPGDGRALYLGLSWK